jgi:hypothetical protein
MVETYFPLLVLRSSVALRNVESAISLTRCEHAGVVRLCVDAAQREQKRQRKPSMKQSASTLVVYYG